MHFKHWYVAIIYLWHSSEKHVWQNIPYLFTLTLAFFAAEAPSELWTAEGWCRFRHDKACCASEVNWWKHYIWNNEYTNFTYNWNRGMKKEMQRRSMHSCGLRHNFCSWKKKAIILKVESELWSKPTLNRG